MKIGPTTSKDFVAALNSQPARAVEKLVTTLEKTEAKVADATKEQTFFAPLSDRYAQDDRDNKKFAFAKFIGAYVGWAAELAVRPHGSSGGELSGKEAGEVLATGYQGLEGLDRQLMGHLLTRVKEGDVGMRNPLGYDEKSAQRFGAIREELAALPPEHMARLDVLADKVQGALSRAQTASQGIYTFEYAREALAEKPQDWSAMARLPADEQAAITSYALRVFDLAAEHIRGQKAQDTLFTTGEG